VLVLNATMSSVNEKSNLRFVMATVYRPPEIGFIIYMYDFNIHVDNEKKNGNGI